jgi:hypothetical protein
LNPSLEPQYLVRSGSTYELDNEELYQSQVGLIGTEPTTEIDESTPFFGELEAKSDGESIKSELASIAVTDPTSKEVEEVITEEKIVKTLNEEHANEIINENAEKLPLEEDEKPQVVEVKTITEKEDDQYVKVEEVKSLEVVIQKDEHTVPIETTPPLSPILNSPQSSHSIEENKVFNHAGILDLTVNDIANLSIEISKCGNILYNSSTPLVGKVRLTANLNSLFH